MHDIYLNDINLNSKQSEQFLSRIIFPDVDMVKKREDFIADLSEIEWESETSFSVDIPQIDFLFVSDLSFTQAKKYVWNLKKLTEERDFGKEEY